MLIDCVRLSVFGKESGFCGFVARVVVVERKDEVGAAIKVLLVALVDWGFSA